MKYTTRDELIKLTSTQALGKLRVAVFRPTEAIAVINTENVLLDIIANDLEVLEILKKYINKGELGHPSGVRCGIIATGMELNEIDNKEDYEKVKEWLKK